MRPGPDTVKHSTKQRVTMDDVAREAGVSRALVSLVMRESPKVSEERRARVLDAAERLGYRPNAIARNLASRRTHTIGVLLHELHNPFYAEIMDGVYEVADELEYHVLIGASGGRPGGERSTLETLLDLRVEGLILIGPRLPTNVIAAASSWVPVVVVARPMRSPRIDSIMDDERLGAALVVQHLVRLGHRRILHIDGGRGAGASTRRSCYTAAMRAAGLGAEVRVVPGDYTDVAGARAAARILASGDLPTAIFAANDFVATGAIDQLDEAGLRVPGDISIVGYDNIFLAALRRLALTTINQPRWDMGRLAFRILVERIEGVRSTPVRYRLAPELVVRDTTGPPPRSAPRVPRRRAAEQPQSTSRAVSSR
jgi:DNA-binding LacI/PurR family transcriptional regulator